MKMKNKLMIKNKKSQIGTTLTWFIAFIIIFFIIVIFLSAAIFSSGRKYASTGWDEITLKEYSGNLEMQRTLFNILNSRIEFDGKQARVKDILRDIDVYGLGSDKKNELIQKLKKQTEDILKDLDEKCYVFQAVYGIDPEKIAQASSSYTISLIEKSTLEFSSFSGNTDSSTNGYNKKQQEKLIESASEITLLRDTTMNVFGVDEKENQRIRIKFYSGKCL